MQFSRRRCLLWQWQRQSHWQRQMQMDFNKRYEASNLANSAERALSLSVSLSLLSLGHGPLEPV